MDNLTLTQSMLDNLPSHLKPKGVGKYIRAGCPFHESTKQRSLSINTENQSFKCFSCGAWGYTEQGRDDYKPDYQPRSDIKRRKVSTTKPVTLEPQDADLKAFQSNLEQGRSYLESRKIPYNIAEKLGAGVGKLGGATRLILPHTNPEGEVVSLYGRRIDKGADFKHYHLSRPKGIFNAQAMNSTEEVWITEGAFDCLALIASGVTNAVAVFGLNGIRWDWLKNVKRIVLCFDFDESGLKAIKEQAEQALLRGIEVLAITKEELGGANDLAEAWEKGTLNLEPLDAEPAEPIAAIDPPPETKPQSKAPTIPVDPLPGYKALEWTQFRDATRYITNEHLEALLGADWSEIEIFGIPSGSRSGGGIAWSLCDSVITAISAEKITVKTLNGSILSHYRDKRAIAGLKMPF
jgi:hypothetical protein